MTGVRAVCWSPELRMFVAEGKPLEIMHGQDGISWTRVDDKESMVALYKFMGAMQERDRIRRLSWFKRLFNRF